MHISAPGKLMLAGEWSVLELGNPCIVLSVNKRVHVEIEESKEISISVDDFKIKNVKAEFDGDNLHWINKLSDEEKERLIFMRGAIETTLQYLGDYKLFKIRSWGEESQLEVDGEMRKIGFGSSAAAVVAVVAALLKLNDNGTETKEDKDIIYKLSTIAHYFAQGKVGSAFDVAASTYGGATVYKRFDPDWLAKEMESGKSVRDIVNKDWSGFYSESLELPDDFILLVGWTRESASTSAMVKQMGEFKSKNRKEYDDLYARIGGLVGTLINEWKDNNKERVLELLRKNEDELRELGGKSGVNIETPELKQLSEIANKHDAAGKLSGAGGGDCGIAVCFSKEIADKIQKEWEDAGLFLLDATIDYKGVKED